MPTEKDSFDWLSAELIDKLSDPEIAAAVDDLLPPQQPENTKPIGSTALDSIISVESTSPLPPLKAQFYGMRGH